MLDQFWLKEHKRNLPVVSVAVGGRLGASGAQDMLRRCESLIEEGFVHLIVDMAEVSFMASSGAGALVVLSERFRVKNGSVQIVRPSSAVSRVIDLLNIHRFLVLSESVEAAEAQILAAKIK